MNQQKELEIERKRPGLQIAMCIMTWLFAIAFVGIAIATLAGVFKHLELEKQIEQMVVFSVFSVGLLIAGIGIWQGKRWGVVLSALILAGTLIYSLQEDVQDRDFLYVFIRGIALLNIIAYHILFWRRFKQYDTTIN